MKATFSCTRLQQSVSFLVLILGCISLLPSSSFSKNQLRQIKAQAATRTLITKIPAAIEIVSTNNLSAENFPIDFTFEVKNVSQKPIYYFWLVLIFPGSEKYVTPPKANGAPMGISFHYGADKFMNLDAKADATDAPILPGEKYTVKLPAEKASRIYSLIRESNFAFGTSVDITCSRVAFGDGTGYRSMQEVTGKLERPSQTVTDKQLARFSRSFTSKGGFPKAVSSRESCFDYMWYQITCEGECLVPWILQAWPGTHKTCDYWEVCGAYYCAALREKHCSDTCNS